MSDTQVYDPRYLRGIELFNSRDFFLAHDVWEEIWQTDRSESRDFLKGLIQMAVCLHHFGNGNTRGARKLYRRCRHYLGAFKPVHMGLDLTDLIGQLDRCCGALDRCDEHQPQIELNRNLLPEIQLPA